MALDNALAIRLEARIRDFEKNLAKASATAGREFGAIEKRADSMRANLASMGKLAFAGFAAGALAALAPLALFDKAMRTIDEASKLTEVADRVGLTTTALQQLGFGFSQAGVDAATFETNMEQFTKRIGAAATEGGRLAEILAANGVALRTSDGAIRPSADLLRAYADLIKNAASEQERMVLATEAFGRGGGDMVNALKDGASGIDDMARAADDAGGVIDEQLLRKAEAVGDQWDAMWRRFDISSKTAILTAVTTLDDLITKANEFGNSAIFRNIAEGMANMGLLDTSGMTIMDPGLARAAGQPLGADARVRDAFATGANQVLSNADQALISALQKRYGHIAPATIIPPGDDEKPKKLGRNKAAEDAIRQAEAVMKVIDQLEVERSLVGATDVERAKSNALRQAGAAATDAQRDQIGLLVEAIYREEQAHTQAAEAAEFFRNAAFDAFSELIPVVNSGNKALDGFLNTMIQAVAQAALLGQGPLAGMFGMGGLGGKTGGHLGGMFNLNLERTAL